MLTIGMMFLSSFLSMNLCVCPEAGITFTAHIVRFHPPFCCDPYCCNPPWQLKAVRGWFSVYRSQNVCQTFLTLHHSLGELHQPHSIFRLWENPMTHAPLMTSPSGLNVHTEYPSPYTFLLTLCIDTKMFLPYIDSTKRTWYICVCVYTCIYMYVYGVYICIYLYIYVLLAEDILGFTVNQRALYMVFLCISYSPETRLESRIIKVDLYFILFFY